MTAMNEAAIKSMAKMIQVMLPYELDYEPTSLGTVCLSEMFEALKTHSPKILEFEGVFNYILKGMDIKNDSKLDDFLVELRDIMIASYPVAGPKDAGHPKDSDVEEDEPNYIKLEWSDKKQGFEEIDPDVVFKVVE